MPSLRDFRPARPLVVSTASACGLALPLALLGMHTPAWTVAFGGFLAGAGLGSVAFHPLGYAVVGPLSELLGLTTTLWLAAAWALVTSVLVLAVPGVRAVRAPNTPR